MRKVRHCEVFIVLLGILLVVPAVQAQTASAAPLAAGDPVLLKLQDYHVATFVEKRGNLYLVNQSNVASRAELINPSRVIPLKKVWTVGEWALTDWTNEREFIRVQVVHVEADRFLCVSWPRHDVLWRYHSTLVPLEHAGMLGRDYDSSQNYRAPDGARIASDPGAEVVAAAPKAPAAAPALVSHSLKPEDPVEIEWRGTWYPGLLLRMRDGKFHVSYDGYSSSSNEWIGPERIRVPGAREALLPVAEESYPVPPLGGDGKPRWRIGDVAWNTFTNEGKYYQVKLLATDGSLWLCMELRSKEVDWKKPQDLYVEKPEQTYYPGK